MARPPAEPGTGTSRGSQESWLAAAARIAVFPEQAGQAALVHQFPRGGRLRFLDIEVLEPLFQQVRDLLWRQGGQEGQRGDELGVLGGPGWRSGRRASPQSRPRPQARALDRRRP